MEKTNMVTQVTNKNTNNNWFMKPILAAGAALMIGTAVAGCSNGNAAPIAAGSNNNAAGDTDANSGSHAAQTGGDKAREEACGFLLVDIADHEQQITEDRSDYLSDIDGHIADTKNANNRNSLAAYIAAGKYPDKEPLDIDVAAVPDPYSKAIHQRAKDFCGPYWDKQTAEVNDIYEHPDADAGSPFTPDWSV